VSDFGVPGVYRLDDLAANAASQPDSGNQPAATITTSNFVLKNVPGGGTLQINSATPGTVTIRGPAVLSATKNIDVNGSGKDKDSDTQSTGK
jgi:hypothetical protein